MLCLQRESNAPSRLRAHSLPRRGLTGLSLQVWIPAVHRPEVAACAAAAVVAHGGIANPDHAEDLLPDAHLFNQTCARRVEPARPLVVLAPRGGADGRRFLLRRYALARRLSAAWAARPGLRPVRWASVLFSESARNALLPDDGVGAWQRLLFPAVGAWRALLRAALPARLLVDWHLLDAPPAATVAEHPMLVTPPDELLPPPVRAAVGAYEAAGGTRLVVSADDGWNASASRPAAEAVFVSRLRAAAAAPPTVALGPLAAVDAAGAQLHAYERPGSMLLFALNNVTGCFGKSTAPLPPPLSGLSLELAGLAAAPASATEVVSGRALPIRAVGEGRWSVALPDVAVVAAVALEL
jgi:hypothetical protein